MNLDGLGPLPIQTPIQTPIPISGRAPIPTPTRAPRLALERDPETRESADPREAGERMEKLFATMLVKEMRKSLPDEGFFGGGAGSDVFNGWFDEFLGERLARDGSLDLAGRVELALREPETETNEEQQ